MMQKPGLVRNEAGQHRKKRSNNHGGEKDDKEDGKEKRPTRY